VRRTMSLMATAFVAAGTLLVPSAAFAEDPTCTDTVVDSSSSELLSGRDDALRAAITRLQGLGANVHVRVEENLPAGGDAYKVARLGDCPSWRDTHDATQLQPTGVLLIYGASVGNDYAQREVSLFVGSHWVGKGINADETLEIRTKVMRPKLLPFDHNKAETFHAVPDGLAAGATRVADDIEHGVPDDGLPGWAWVLIIFGTVVGLIGLYFLIRWLIRGSGTSGRYGYGSGSSGGYSSNTFIGGSSYYGSSGGSGSSSSAGDTGGSSNC
jgi:hypothetical protein